MRYPDNMEKKTIRIEKQEFLINETLTASVNAAFARAGVYVGEVRDSKKEVLRRDLKQALLALVEDYRIGIPDGEVHLENIQRIADRLKEDHKPILRGGRFRLGIAQKAVNLFLKYMWCMSEIEQPPHCPFDRIVLSAIAKFAPKPPLVPWTKMDDPNEYRRYVSAARAAAAGAPLPEWELRFWSDSQPGHQDS